MTKKLLHTNRKLFNSLKLNILNKNFKIMSIKIKDCIFYHKNCKKI